MCKRIKEEKGLKRGRRGLGWGEECTAGSLKVKRIDEKEEEEKEEEEGK